MKKIILWLVIIVSCYRCTKDNSDFSKFVTGTYSGEKSIFYLGSNSTSVDTITIKFDSGTYSYSGSSTLDYGRGNYVIIENSIEFSDGLARNALYSWEWILGGTHQLRMVVDSLILNQNGSYVQVTCRLVKIAK
jgi:hypothetical protein